MASRCLHLTYWAHLARRFFGSLSRQGPPPADEQWVVGLLNPAELGLWRRMSAPDRRHAVGVARAVAEDRLAPAALLHDAGKVESGLGTFGRVLATLGATVRPPRRWPESGRIGAYLRHDVIGSRLLAEAGSSPLVVAWAREHHLPPGDWTVDSDDGRRLKAADDD